MIINNIAPNFYLQNSPDKGQSIPVLRLTHFAEKCILDFGSAIVGKPKVRQLSIKNENPFDVDVIVERIPPKKKFNLSVLYVSVLCIAVQIWKTPYDKETSAESHRIIKSIFPSNVKSESFVGVN